MSTASSWKSGCFGKSIKMPATSMSTSFKICSPRVSQGSVTRSVDQLHLNNESNEAKSCHKSPKLPNLEWSWRLAASWYRDKFETHQQFPASIGTVTKNAGSSWCHSDNAFYTPSETWTDMTTRHQDGSLFHTLTDWELEPLARLGPQHWRSWVHQNDRT